MTMLLEKRGRAATAPKVLIVDDSDADVEMLSRMLRRHFGDDVRIEHAEAGSLALDMIDSSAMDVALVDYRLPDIDGLELISELRRRRPELATVLMTGQGSERVAAQAIKRGASDYLVKRDITGEVLGSAVSAAIDAAHGEKQAAHHLHALRRTSHEMDHYVRSLSHDMTANFMLLESSFARIKKFCGATPLPDLLHGVTHVEACLRESKRFLDDMQLLGKTGGVHTEPAAIDVRAVVAELTFELEAELAERGARVEVDGELPVAWCNETRLRQALGNLLRNALKHGCAAVGGAITISSPTLPAPEGFAWLRVHDNGRGIPAAAREEVFLPGVRLAGTSAAGTGMGLAIVKKIVDLWGGGIHVADEPAGTAFLLSLPTA